MPSRNIELPHDLDDFVLTMVEGGRYSNASEMVQAALRVLGREERTHEAKRIQLQPAAGDGDVSLIAEVDVFRKLWLVHNESSLFRSEITPLDHLAPDEEVLMKTPLEKDQRRPTMKRKTTFLVQAKGRGSIARKTPFATRQSQGASL
jgi:putative addiction module CopG family antidote